MEISSNIIKIRKKPSELTHDYRLRGLIELDELNYYPIYCK